jgi:hypothetical protein
VSEFVDDIRRLVQSGIVQGSDHAYGRLQERDISYRQLVNSMGAAEVLERYPDYQHGPCFLARHVIADMRVAHAVWGLPRSGEKIAALVTAYWPDAREWDSDLRKRR